MSTATGAQRPARFLIDTGVELSGIESREVHVVTMRVVLHGGHPHVFTDVFLTSMPRANDDVDGLIGRDILSLLRFEYDGPAGTFRLERATTTSP